MTSMGTMSLMARISPPFLETGPADHSANRSFKGPVRHAHGTLFNGRFLSVGGLRSNPDFSMPNGTASSR